MPRIRFFLLASALLCFPFACPSAAQEQPTPPGDATIIRPTDNGYNDLLAACAALTDKPSIEESSPPSTLDKAQRPDATLAEKRAAVRDPRVRQAIALLHAALSKPVLKPSFQTHHQRVSTYGVLHSLLHLLPVLLYVQLADGSTASALDTLEEQIALGDAMQRWDFLSALMGQSVIDLGVNPIATHLDRLSVGDCSRLFDLLRVELNAPSPAIEGLHAESARAVADLREALKSLGEATPAAGKDDGNEIVADNLNAAEVKEVTLLQKQKGTALNAFTQNVARRIASLNEASIAANLEPSAAVPSRAPAENETDAIAEKMAHFFAPKVGNVGRVLDYASVSRAGLQLLAVSAAISRYRWEHNALPDSLAPLKLGTLATDPFTQGTIVYVRSLDGKQYSLSFAGPLPRDADEKVIPNGTRKPVTLP